VHDGRWNELDAAYERFGKIDTLIDNIPRIES